MKLRAFILDVWIALSLFHITGAWINEAVLNRFCIVQSGCVDAVCIDGACMSSSGAMIEAACSVYHVEAAAARFERLRDHIRRRSVTAVRANFDFSAQVHAANYSEFIFFHNRPRFTRAIVPGSISGHFGNSTVAIRRLINLFMDVPGADWLQGVYEPLLVWTPEETLKSLLIPREEPYERLYTEKALLRGFKTLPGPLISVMLGFQGFENLEADLLRLWALATARLVTRFTDTEHIAYVEQIKRVLAQVDILISTTAEIELARRVPAEIMEWVYDLITRSTPALMPPLVMQRITNALSSSNRDSQLTEEISSTAHWLTEPLHDLAPELAWNELPTEAHFIDACRIVIHETDLLSEPKQIITLRILHRIAEAMGFNKTEVFQLIPRPWRDFAVSFDPQPHHFLDGVITALALITSNDAAAPQHLVTVLKAIRHLEVETIEAQSRGLRIELEDQSMRIAEHFAVIVGLEDEASPGMFPDESSASAQKSTMYRIFMDRVIRMSRSYLHAPVTAGDDVAFSHEIDPLAEATDEEEVAGQLDDA